MKTLVLLDLDRTAFKTDQHFDDFCAVISDKFGIDASKLKEKEHRLTKKPGPYSPVDDIRYDESIEVEPGEVLRVAGEELSSNLQDYLFEDVVPFLEWQKQQGNQVVLITVGTHEYQTHKVNLADELIQYPLIITRDSKSNVLTNHLRFIENGGVILQMEDITVEADNAVLIDDRAATFTDAIPMPNDSRLKLVRIRRDGVEYSENKTPEGVSEIKTLAELINK